MAYYVIYAIILLLLTIYIHNSKIYENYTNINVDNVLGLGNHLCIYYYKMVISILEKKDFNYSHENEFMKEFPQYIEWNEELYNKFTENNITKEDIDVVDMSFWTVTNSKYEKTHNIMKSTINKIFDDTFKKLKLNKTVKNPIIHFRCADIPFSKHGHYYFQKYSYFQKALKDIENKIGTFTDITILFFFDHHSNDKNKEACSSYLNKLKEYITSLNPKYNIKVESNSNVDDFVTMFYAPAVISTISSFSFMAGFFGNGIYIQPNMMINDNEVCLDCDNPYKGYNISHNKVDDYHNVDEVYKLLIE